MISQGDPNHDRTPRASGGSRGGRRARLVRFLVLAAAGSYLLVAAAAARPGAQANGTTSVQAGVYTKAQAARGEKLFASVCGNCHLAEEFVGPMFMGGWTSQPTLGLFDLIRRTMPEDNPGSLSRREYSDVIAYIFQMNGMPDGQTELADSDEGLKKVIIEGPYKAASGGP